MPALSRTSLAIAFLLLPLAAMAQQQPPPPNPEQQALGSMLLEAMQREASLRTQLIGAQTERDALRKQVDDAKPKPADPPAKIVPVPNATLPEPKPTESPK
jgi:hypothetical protein